MRFILFHAAVIASFIDSDSCLICLSLFLKLAQTFSIGFKTGEYGGR